MKLIVYKISLYFERLIIFFLYYIDHKEAVLRIDTVGREDKGMYQCFVRNDQESAQGTAELKLGGRCEYLGWVKKNI